MITTATTKSTTTKTASASTIDDEKLQFVVHYAMKKPQAIDQILRNTVGDLLRKAVLAFGLNADEASPLALMVGAREQLENARLLSEYFAGEQDSVSLELNAVHYATRVAVPLSLSSPRHKQQGTPVAPAASNSKNAAPSEAQLCNELLNDAVRDVIKTMRLKYLPEQMLAALRFVKVPRPTTLDAMAALKSSDVELDGAFALATDMLLELLGEKVVALRQQRQMQQQAHDESALLGKALDEVNDKKKTLRHMTSHLLRRELKDVGEEAANALRSRKEYSDLWRYCHEPGFPIVVCGVTRAGKVFSRLLYICFVCLFAVS